MSITFSISGASGDSSGSPIQSGSVQQLVAQWTAPSGVGQTFFSTAISTSSATTDYPTSIEIANANSSWTPGLEVTYTYNQQNGIGNGFSADPNAIIGGGFQCGAMAAFTPVAGQNYLIYINQRSASIPTPASPTYNLTWGAYPMNGQCQCGISTSLASCLVSKFALTTPSCSGLSYYKIGTYSLQPGYYTLVGCTAGASGGLLNLNGWPDCIPAFQNCTAYSAGEFIWSAGNGTVQVINDVPNTCPDNSGNTAFWQNNGTTEPGGTECPANNGISSAGIYGASGFYAEGCWVQSVYDYFTALQDVYPTEVGFDIATYPPTVPPGSLPNNAPPYTGRFYLYGQGCGIGGICSACSFTDYNGGDLGIAGYTAGTYELYYTDCSINFFSLANLSGVIASGSNWEMSGLSFKNSDLLYGWDDVTISLSINGGSTLATDTVTFPENNTEAVSLTFAANPSSGLLTATFSFARNGVTFGSISAPLYPVFNLAFGNYGFPMSFNSATNTLTIESSPSTITGCSSSIKGVIVNPGATYLNGGGQSNWFGGVLEYEISSTTNMYEYGGSCTQLAGTQTLTSATPAIWIEQPASGTSSQITITPIWTVSGATVYTFPSVTINVVWP